MIWGLGLLLSAGAVATLIVVVTALVEVVQPHPVNTMLLGMFIFPSVARLGHEVPPLAIVFPQLTSVVVVVFGT